MKQFLINTFLFTLILICVLFILNQFQSKFNTNPYHYSKGYEEIYSNAINANAIILGTSHAVHSIKPSILQTGDKWFNFSLNGAGPSYYLNWYNYVFKNNYNTPKVCIYSIDWFMFDKSWLWRKFEQDSEYLSVKDFIQLLKVDNLNQKTLVTNRMPLFKYRKDIFNSIRLKKGSKSFLPEHFDNGFIPYSIPFQENKFAPKRKDIEINPKEINAFKELIKILQKENVKIIFVVTPEYKTPISFFYGETFDYIEDFAINNDIPILNFNTNLIREEINFDISNFSDWGHMNLKGSKEFSNILNLELNKVLKTRTHN